MKRILLTATSLSLAGLGCGTAAVAPNVTTAQPPSTVIPAKVAIDLPEAKAAKTLTMREPGDYVTYRFSGSYRNAPVSLTRQVVERSDDRIVVDVTIDDGPLQHRLRLRVADDGELLSVAKLEGTVQRPFGILAYEMLMNEITLSADDNAGMVDSSNATLDIAGVPLAVTLTTYRVRVGEQDAILKTAVADQISFGDVGGEIRTVEGELLYQAEIVDIGHGEHGIASFDDEDLYYDQDE